MLDFCLLLVGDICETERWEKENESRCSCNFEHERALMQRALLGFLCLISRKCVSIRVVHKCDRHPMYEDTYLQGVEWVLKDEKMGAEPLLMT